MADRIKDRKNDIRTYNEIFLNNMKQIQEYSELVYLCHTHQEEEIKRRCGECVQGIEVAFQKAIENLELYNETYEILNLEEIEKMIFELKEAHKFQDYVYLSDILEMQVIPVFYNMQSILRNVVTIYSEDNNYLESNLKNLEKKDLELAETLRKHSLVNQEKYLLEYTNIGTISLSIQEENEQYYIHSLDNPFEDGRMFAQRYFKPGMKQYIVYGFGLGYHIIMMGRKYKDAKIKVYEYDLNTLYLAFSYMDLSEMLLNSEISIHYDPKFQRFGEHLKEAGVISNQNKRVIIYAPSINLIPFPTVRSLMENMIAQENIQEQAYPLLKDNFISNIKYYKDIVDKLEENFKGKDVFIIAAGPSLDKNIDKLRLLNREKSIILATGTVFKKLLSQKIMPDYVVVLDPNPWVYKQIEDVENNNIPMIYLSTAYKGFAQNYQGDKYIVFQNELDLSEIQANGLGSMLYQTGGSVSTIALEVAIRLKAKRAIFLGLDLAYTKNLGHAEGTSQRERKAHTEYIEVKSIDGGTVLSSKIFCDFRQWIEKRIIEETECEVIDATEGGAYIEGTKVMTMSEVVETFI